ncbi:PKD domain-containing protein [Reichenbachiella carrageenanivorans]|uniref:PKD domain-containing protein n=1 Tax=Reichenbachiella carrageenanivorans TaxID=2979869 RepID=A0ABY6D2B9_9BACT|nr:PKD domain-containing protein [Reichenbachiella carrageenanivorans]UXX80064.1 PKD domain-containing protein [Reichenbachiella carrageenanivorans]
MKYLIAFILHFMISSYTVAQTADYDSVYLINNCVELDATGSVQEDRKDLVYQWTFGEGILKYGVKVNHCYSYLGTYEVVLSVIDPQINALFQKEWTCQVEVTENYHLSIDISKDVDKSITASSILSCPSTSGQSDFFWDYGDGTYDVGKEVIHKYPRAGSYSVRLLAQVIHQNDTINLVQTTTLSIQDDEI